MAEARRILRQNREWKAIQPQMNQPSREAMAGKLRIYADGERKTWSAASLARPTVGKNLNSRKKHKK
jgi:hypothetical protein